jgi:glycosyltransferase involved in cell wall biosynthesis
LEILFVHPNFPGQFRRLAARLAHEPGVHVYALGDASWMEGTSPVDEVTLWSYPSVSHQENGIHPHARNFHAAVCRGHQTAQTLITHKRQGFEPDVIVVHPGWGDAFYLKTIFPGTPVVGFFEYYYRIWGADVGFDPEFPRNFDDLFRIHTLNATQLLALESCDVGYCPTQWQRTCFPAAYQDRLQVIHDGIDTQRVSPNPAATIELPSGHVVHAGDEILTFVARNLEPYRGYHIFMRALPHILKERPQCHVLIVGGDGVSYGRALPPGQSYRDIYLGEVREQLPMDRVHFLGVVPYNTFLQVIQVSRVHVYLTYPFILSWSVLEAMSAGCLVVASATPPVEEVITHGTNGLLVPFRDVGALATAVVGALEDPEHYASLRTHARQTIIDRYDFSSKIYPAFHKLLEHVML